MIVELELDLMESFSLWLRTKVTQLIAVQNTKRICFERFTSAVDGSMFFIDVSIAQHLGLYFSDIHFLFPKIGPNMVIP